jgi:hypothetical protein
MRSLVGAAQTKVGRAFRRMRFGMMVGAMSILALARPAAAGNGCKDTIGSACTFIRNQHINCCQILSDKHNYAHCYCKLYNDSAGYNYLNGGIDETGPGCVQQNDTCC